MTKSNFLSKIYYIVKLTIFGQEFIDLEEACQTHCPAWWWKDDDLDLPGP